MKAITPVIALFSAHSLLVPVHLLAEPTAQASPEQTDHKSKAMETILVEARLWRENIHKVPSSTTVITPELTRVDTDINAIQQATAGVSIQQSTAQQRVNIRGISSPDLSFQDPLGFFINDVALPQGASQLPALFNLESIEVLKGPQSAFYGRNTEAGAVKVQTKNPTAQTQSWFSLQAGQYRGTEQNGASQIYAGGLSGALIEDAMTANIAVRIEEDEGPYLNLLDQSNKGGAQDRLSLSAGLDYQFNTGTQLLFKTVIDDNDLGRNRFRFANGDNQTNPFVTHSDVDSFDDDKIAVHSLRIDHEFEQVHLLSITGVTHYQRAFAIDLDATPAPLPATQFALDNDAYSQELRISSIPNKQAINWLAGLYVYREDTTHSFQLSPRFITTDRHTEVEQNGQALFGQVELSFYSDWSLTLAGRLERIKKSAEQAFQTPTLALQYQAEVKHTEFLPTASLSYQATDNALIYLSYAKGYLPGDVNYSSAASAESFTFAPEFSDLFELGWKYASTDLSSSLTAYVIETKDKQIIDILPGFVQQVTNAARTESYGVELSSRYQFTPSWFGYLNLGIQKSEAKSYLTHLNPFSPAMDLSGNALPFTPEKTYALGLEYNQQAGLFAKVEVRGSSEYYFDSSNALSQPSHTLLDAEIGYQFNRIAVALWAKNVTDESVISRAVNVAGDTIVEDMLAPALGVKISGVFN